MKFYLMEHSCRSFANGAEKGLCRSGEVTAVGRHTERPVEREQGCHRKEGTVVCGAVDLVRRAGTAYRAELASASV